LYRNGVQIASVADAVGALPVSGCGWAVGSTGEGWQDTFSGAIDEVAIYGHSLTAAQVSSHFASGTTSVAGRLTITRSGNNITITWPAGTLQQADSVTGPYTDMAVTSPYTTPATGPAKFYRFHL
jgi:hypothetical protein